MVNDKMVNGFMKKKLYSRPQIEVVCVNTLLLQAFGSASMPLTPFSTAPQHRVKVF